MNSDFPLYDTSFLLVVLCVQALFVIYYAVSTTVAARLVCPQLPLSITVGIGPVVSEVVLFRVRIRIRAVPLFACLLQYTRQPSRLHYRLISGISTASFGILAAILFSLSVLSLPRSNTPPALTDRRQHPNSDDLQVIVTAVAPNSRAALAGIRPGMILQTANDRPVASALDFMIQYLSPLDSVSLCLRLPGTDDLPVHFGPKTASFFRTPLGLTVANYRNLPRKSATRGDLLADIGISTLRRTLRAWWGAAFVPMPLVKSGDPIANWIYGIPFAAASALMVFGYLALFTAAGSTMRFMSALLIITASRFHFLVPIPIVLIAAILLRRRSEVVHVVVGALLFYCLHGSILLKTIYVSLLSLIGDYHHLTVAWLL